MTPSLTVVIPTFDRAPMLREAVDSCLHQPVEDLQIIVADDGSTDETAAIIGEFGPDVEYLALSHSGLPAVARNRALERARSAMVAFLDSDDLFLPDKLPLQRAALASRPGAALAYSDGVFFSDDPATPLGHVLDGLPRPDGDCLPDLLRGNFLFPATVLARRSCIEEIGGFDEDPRMRGAEDFDLWLRLAAVHEMVFAPGVVAAIRRHPGSLSADTAAIRRAAMLSLKKLDALHPDLTARHRAQRHEGFARHHAAVAVARWTARDPGAVRDAFAAAAHALRAPRQATSALLAWRKSRELRKAACPPTVDRDKGDR